MSLRERQPGIKKPLPEFVDEAQFPLALDNERGNKPINVIFTSKSGDVIHSQLTPEGIALFASIGHFSIGERKNEAKSSDAFDVLPEKSQILSEAQISSADTGTIELVNLQKKKKPRGRSKQQKAA